jgi:hypothetical protein
MLTRWASQTHPSVQSVHLVGSWDNFNRYYTMERDTRRDRGQWKGCYSFRDIICDDDLGKRQKRNGGLRMGQTYYYYVSIYYPRRLPAASWLTPPHLV